MKTFGSLFTGFGGADLGAMMAGLTPIWGVELDPKIAGVGNLNLGGHIRIADVLGEDPRNYDQVDVFHASPPCVSFSVAKAGGEELPLDLAMASKVAEFITVLQPKIVTIENVIAYRKSKSWAIIERTLNDLGYWLSVDLVNFADLGVPQTRTRMIVRAIKGDCKPTKLVLTHTDPKKINFNQMPLFDAPTPWIGWYAAIADLIPTLPDSQFAPWQLARIPEELMGYILVMTEHHTHSDQGREGRGGVIPEICPANTVLPGSGTARAMVQSCLSSNSGNWRAFICEGSAAGEDNKFTMPIRMEDEPIFTQRATQNNPRAFVVDCQLAGDPDTDRGLTIRDENDPIYTIAATQQKRIGRAFIINGDNATRDLSIKDQHDPAFTVSDGGKHPIKGFSSGRVVAMTPRCLARFQSFPDHYVLPENKTLACKGIGNAVPPLGYAKIVKPLLEYI